MESWDKFSYSKIGYAAKQISRLKTGTRIDPHSIVLEDYVDVYPNARVGELNPNSQAK